MLDCQLALSHFFYPPDRSGSAFPVYYSEKIDSTQNLLKTLLAQGAPASSTVFSYQQTHGRGRNGSVWQTLPGRHLFFSHAFLTQRQSKELSSLSLMIGLTLRDYLQDNYQINAKVKWPNDLYIEDKKLSGILCETYNIGQNLYCLIGIGINISDHALVKKEPLSAIKASYAQNFSTKTIHRWELLGGILHALKKNIKNLDANKNLLRERFSMHDYLLNKRITIDTGVSKITGTACGINNKGALMIKQDQGQNLAIYSGHIILDP